MKFSYYTVDDHGKFIDHEFKDTIIGFLLYYPLLILSIIGGLILFTSLSCPIIQLANIIMADPVSRALGHDKIDYEILFQSILFGIGGLIPILLFWLFYLYQPCEKPDFINKKWMCAYHNGNSYCLSVKDILPVFDDKFDYWRLISRSDNFFNEDLKKINLYLHNNGISDIVCCREDFYYYDGTMITCVSFSKLTIE